MLKFSRRIHSYQLNYELTLRIIASGWITRILTFKVGSNFRTTRQGVVEVGDEVKRDRGAVKLS